MRPYLLHVLVIFSLCIFLSLDGCTGINFEDAGLQPDVEPRFELDSLPFDEYWMGIVFNEAKIGFSHLSVDYFPQDGHAVIKAEMVLSFPFMHIQKNIVLRSWDLIDSDFSLREFEYESIIDGSSMLQRGRIEEGRLVVDIHAGGRTEREILAVSGNIVPSSAIGLIPLYHGLHKGSSAAYRVYEWQTQSIADVSLQVETFEKSRLFKGAAYKIRISFLGLESYMWIGLDGVPRLEMTHGGEVVSRLENEYGAKQYQLEGSLNKSDIFIDYSLIKTEKKIKKPREADFLDVLFTVKGNVSPFPSDGRQSCTETGEGVRCLIHRDKAPWHHEIKDEFDGMLQSFLLPTHAVPCTDESISILADKIADGAIDDMETISRVLQWLSVNIEKKPVDAFSALDVLKKGQGECQGFSFLYASFVRALKIPTRIVNGMVYSEDYGGFLYHTWVESWINGNWIAVDPVLGQIKVDATHVKLVIGETISEMMPLLDSIGKLSASIIRVEQNDAF